MIWVPELRGVQFEPGRPGMEAREAKRPPRAAARPSMSGVSMESEESGEHRRWCPACGEHEFKRWPFGWDAHAAYTCGGRHSPTPEARKREFKRRFGVLFGGGTRR